MPPGGIRFDPRERPYTVTGAGEAGSAESEIASSHPRTITPTATAAHDDMRATTYNDPKGDPVPYVIGPPRLLGGGKTTGVQRFDCLQRTSWYAHLRLPLCSSRFPLPSSLAPLVRSVLIGHPSHSSHVLRAQGSLVCGSIHSHPIVPLFSQWTTGSSN